jgi:AraC-like DNA-binding protein
MGDPSTYGYHHAVVRAAAEASSPRVGASTLLHASARLGIGRFDCEAGHPRWTIDNHNGPWPLLAFPGTPVEIAQAGHREVVATSNQVMLYNPHQIYRRRIIDPRGDHCVFVAVDGELLAEIGATTDPALAQCHERPFTTAWAPADPPAVLTVTLLARHLESTPPAEHDGLMVEESLLRLLHVVFARPVASGSRGRPREAARRADVARALERELAASFRDACSLQQLAESVGVSAFHASRVFREHTGLTIHEYRHRLRLQAVLARLGEARVDLMELALETGFCSHSHLTEAFRRVFGAPPSRWRGRIDGRRLRDLTARLQRAAPGEHRARS